MKKGMIEMGFSSFNKTHGRIHACAQDASAQSNEEQMENPFLNLHPKIYCRQQDPSSKMNIDKNRKVEIDLKSSALFRSKDKREQQTRVPTSSSLERTKDNSDVGWVIMRNLSHNSPTNYRFTDKEDSDKILKGLDKIAYLNERNISLSKEDSSLAEKAKFSFPLITTARNLSRESIQSVYSGFAPSRENRLDVLPQIRHGSFISMVYEEEEKKRRRKRHKRGRNISNSNCETQDKLWVDAVNTPKLPEGTVKDHRFPFQQKETSDTHGYKSIYTADILSTSKHHCKGEIPRNKVNSSQSHSTYDHGEGTNSDIMVLKAKLHRSSFI